MSISAITHYQKWGVIRWLHVNDFDLTGFPFCSPDVFPQQIEGVKMILNKTLSSFFKVTFPLSWIHIQTISFMLRYWGSEAGQLLLWYESVYIVLDFGYRYIIMSFPDFKGSITVKWSHFLSSSNCWHYFHIINDYQKSSWYFVKAPVAIPTVLLKYLVRNIVVFDLVSQS